METKFVVPESESGTDRSSDFCVSATLPDSDRQTIYSVAWLPHASGCDLGEVVVC